MSTFYVIAYDIKEAEIRRGVVELLENYGTRVQYSVFECTLSGSQFHTLHKALCACIGTEDRLHFYPLCRWCRERIVILGDGRQQHEEAFYLV